MEALLGLGFVLAVVVLVMWIRLGDRRKRS